VIAQFLEIQKSINASHWNYWKKFLFILYPNEGITGEVTKTNEGKRPVCQKILLVILSISSLVQWSKMCVPCWNHSVLQGSKRNIFTTVLDRLVLFISNYLRYILLYIGKCLTCLQPFTYSTISFVCTITVFMNHFPNPAALGSRFN